MVQIPKKMIPTVKEKEQLLTMLTFCHWGNIAEKISLKGGQVNKGCDFRGFIP